MDLLFTVKCFDKSLEVTLFDNVQKKKSFFKKLFCYDRVCFFNKVEGYSFFTIQLLTAAFERITIRAPLSLYIIFTLVSLKHG